MTDETSIHEEPAGVWLTQGAPDNAIPEESTRPIAAQRLASGSGRVAGPRTHGGLGLFGIAATARAVFRRIRTPLPDQTIQSAI